MLVDFYERLVADLRSGVPQGQRRLFNGQGYCCMGRICVLAGCHFHRDDDSGVFYIIDTSGIAPAQRSGILSREAMQAPGIRTCDGRFHELSQELRTKFNIPWAESYSLLSLNDGYRLTFEQIAEVIDEVWMEL